MKRWNNILCTDKNTYTYLHTHTQHIQLYCANARLSFQLKLHPVCASLLYNYRYFASISSCAASPIGVDFYHVVQGHYK